MENRTLADALSWLPDSVNDKPPIVIAASIFTVESNPKLITWIKNSYWEDSWCLGILKDLKQGIIDTKLHITLKHGLLFIGQHLIIPKYKHLHKHLFQLAHDNLEHFSAEKSYANLHDDFYWPNMWRNLTNGYVAGFHDCQHNKGNTMRCAGPLHLLPVSDNWFNMITINFVGPLPKDEGFDAIVTITDRLGTDIQISACNSDITAEDFAYIFFDEWYCKNGCPLEIISNWDKIFISKFWCALDEAHWDKTQDVNGVSPTNRQELRTNEQNGHTVPPIPCGA